MLKLKVTIKTKEKSVSEIFEVSSLLTMNEDDPEIKRVVSQVMQDFDCPPESIKVQATLVL